MIKIIAGGKKHNSWTAAAIEDYQKRMKKPYIYDWIFCDEAKLEAKVLAQNPSDYIILLDEAGTELTSPRLYKVLEDQITQNKNIIIVIGGAFGHFSPALKSRSNLTLSLSQMTFPHQICRLILAEQLYRAQQIALGHPYHHA